MISVGWAANLRLRVPRRARADCPMPPYLGRTSAPRSVLLIMSLLNSCRPRSRWCSLVLVWLGASAISACDAPPAPTPSGLASIAHRAALCSADYDGIIALLEPLSDSELGGADRVIRGRYLAVALDELGRRQEARQWAQRATDDELALAPEHRPAELAFRFGETALWLRVWSDSLFPAATAGLDYLAAFPLGWSTEPAILTAPGCATHSPRTLTEARAYGRLRAGTLRLTDSRCYEATSFLEGGLELLASAPAPLAARDGMSLEATLANNLAEAHRLCHHDYATALRIRDEGLTIAIEADAPHSRALLAGGIAHLLASAPGGSPIPEADALSMASRAAFELARGQSRSGAPAWLPARILSANALVTHLRAATVGGDAALLAEVDSLVHRAQTLPTPAQRVPILLRAARALDAAAATDEAVDIVARALRESDLSTPKTDALTHSANHEGWTFAFELAASAARFDLAFQILDRMQSTASHWQATAPQLDDVRRAWARWAESTGTEYPLELWAVGPPSPSGMVTAIRVQDSRVEAISCAPDSCAVQAFDREVRGTYSTERTQRAERCLADLFACTQRPAADHPMVWVLAPEFGTVSTRRLQRSLALGPLGVAPGIGWLTRTQRPSTAPARPVTIADASMSGGLLDVVDSYERLRTLPPTGRLRLLGHGLAPSAPGEGARLSFRPTGSRNPWLTSEELASLPLGGATVDLFACAGAGAKWSTAYDRHNLATALLDAGAMSVLSFTEPVPTAWARSTIAQSSIQSGSLPWDESLFEEGLEHGATVFGFPRPAEGPPILTSMTTAAYAVRTPPAAERGSER